MAESSHSDSPFYEHLNDRYREKQTFPFLRSIPIEALVELDYT